MAAEPVSMTLAALSMLDPAIKSVRKAYGVYKLTKAFGDHYISVQRRLDGQQARLEITLSTILAIMPTQADTARIIAELGHLSKHFQECQDLIASIDGHIGTYRPQNLRWGAHNVSVEASPSPSVLTDQISGQISTKKTPASTRASRRKKLGNWFSHRQKGRLTETNSSETFTSGAELPDPNDGPNSNEALQAAALEAETAQSLQSKASIASKSNWIKHRKDFINHVDEIQASNDLISQIVLMKALSSIHKTFVVPEFRGDMPEILVSVQNSLLRLHHALNYSTVISTSKESIIMSLRVMEAAAYVRLQSKLTVQHDYLNFHSDTAIYPLQVQSQKNTMSTVVLAETTLTPQGSNKAVQTVDSPLAMRLSGVSPDPEEPFKTIGSIADGQSSTDLHYLYEDISTSWTLQDTLADLITTRDKFSTFIHLAVQVSISYIYFISIGATHRYPRLGDYQYYKPTEDKRRSLGPKDVLEPYLCVGFGSKSPRKSTRDIGGISSHLAGDEAMTSLGLILHQLGCWKLVEDEDLGAARDVAKFQRKDLQTNAGISYTQVVDMCFAAKEDDWDRHARTEKVYRQVVGPLQKLISELRWD